MSACARHVERYWADQLALMRSLPASVAAREPDAVHDLRAAGRRLRTTIAAFAPLERRGPSARVAAELAWYNDVLGAARDAEVIHEKVAELTDDPDLISPLAARRRLAAERADEMLASRRAAKLLDAVGAFIANPWRGAVDRRGKGPSAKRLKARLVWSQRRVARAWGALEAGVDGGAGSADRASEEHRLRRRAKAARYVLESLDGAVPGARGRAERYAELAALLGILQDVVVIDRALSAVRPSRATQAHAAQVRAEQARRADEARSALGAAVRAALGEGPH